MKKLSEVARPEEQADTELRRLAAMVESCQDAIISKDLNGIVTYWNTGAERLFGYKAAEIVGKPVSLLMPPGHRDEMDTILERSRRGERIEHFETVRLKKNGEAVTVSLSVSPIKDSSGRVIGTAKIARDITEKIQHEAERDRLYKEAQEAVRIRDSFLSVAGHELRTPLTSLQFQLHTLHRRIESGDSAKALDLLSRAQLQVGRLSLLTEELLDVTRLTGGQIVLQLEQTDLVEIVTEVSERLKDFANRFSSDFRIEAPPQATGFWDRSRLDQVTTNLLSNAVKFGSGKPIEIRIEGDTNRVKLAVSDYGIGISPKDQSRIFERFERAVSKQSYGGMGLGLWISRQIVEAHGGSIEVTSEAGQGSTFRVELPREGVA